MKKQKAKLFWKIGVSPKDVRAIPFDDVNSEYYSFLKEQYAAGYRQIIISSQIMIDLIKSAVLKDSFSVYAISLSEDDNEMQEDILRLLNLIEKEPACFNLLIDRLSFLAENSSIDIQSISLNGHTAEGKPVDFFVQSNGLFGVNDDSFSMMQKKISTFVERCLFG